MEKESELHPKSPSAQEEENVLAFWNEQDIFRKSLEKESPQGEFIFYEGPPTANGHPGIHHLESRAFKDAVLRYKTMRGFHVRRKAGWDTQGLPVELEVEKELGLSSKREIEAYGITKFNEKCKENVWKYVDEWDAFTNRIGYWIDTDHPYVTYEPRYIESLWWILSKVNERGLLYKDYKVVPWCPRCGTALSSHELADGYKDVKDLSIYAKFELVDEPKTFLVAWTTTPWTLPGNVALAVGEDITYVKVEEKGERLIVAKDRLGAVGESAKILEEMKGADLVGKKYVPLYPYLAALLPESEKEKLSKAYSVYPASFVTTEDGTGIVHTAVMYGQDDFELGTEVGLPKVHLVDPAGRFIEGTDFLSGSFVKDSDTEVAIIKDLAHRGLLFKKEKYAHSYPHCWRCKTPLIYYARDSWYIRMSELRDALVAANEEINWEPAHIKEGRFGEWLEGVKDWAISRERYWGTPLPIWVSEDGNQVEVIGSLAELKTKTTRHNRFFIVRHGESTHNLEGICTSSLEGSPLTEKGKEQARAAGEKLQAENVTLIVSSPLVRTKETAQIIAAELGIASDAVATDPRLREIGFGEMEGRPIAEYRAQFKNLAERFTKATPGGEAYDDIRKRVLEAIFELDQKHENATIVIVTHDAPSWLLAAGAEGLSSREIADAMPFEGNFLQTGDVREIPFAFFPHNEAYELDLHKPFIDGVTWKNADGTVMRRVPEIADVWFDSGAMPFAQDHYPFENESWVDGPGYPADYICEAIDQTRGWFYTLHAIGVLLERGKAYKNVICLGHILDREGLKMSKSRGNAVDPWGLIEKYGVDPLRFWMYSVNAPGDSKNFDEGTVDEIVKKVGNLLRNSVAFYELSKSGTGSDQEPASENMLDQWMLSLLGELVGKIETSLDAYDLFSATRAIRDFIADLSQWYIRRSRDRFKGEDLTDRGQAEATLRYTLETLSKLLAPFMPFLAEDVFGRVRGGDVPESVHLADWPTAPDINEEVLADMQKVRRFASIGLELRAKANVKVRQPLARLTIKDASLEGKEGLLGLLRDELNVREVVFSPELESEAVLDTEITEDLKREGWVREIVREIQTMRKALGLTPGEEVILSLDVAPDGKAFFEEYREAITKPTNVTDVRFEATEGGRTLDLDPLRLTLDIRKAE